MDPRDPRARSDDLPLLRQQVTPSQEPDPEPEQREDNFHSRSVPLADPERYGPVAPEPKWEKPPFNREKFLLYLVAWILGVQFGILILAGFVCGYGQYLNFSRTGKDEIMPAACPGILAKVKDSAAESLAVLLALLGGGTVAVSEYQRRQDRR